MPGLIGKKVRNDQHVQRGGQEPSVHCARSGPQCVVTQVKTADKDGYDAVQVGFGDRKDEPHYLKPWEATSRRLASQRQAALSRSLLVLDRTTSPETRSKLGDVFSEGEFVSVVGTSKGRGFQGVVRRHGFAGVGQATHGQHNRMRAPGSIGAASTPARVYKGMRMAGQMGNVQVTIENLQVLKVMSEEGLLVVKGAVPGHKGATVIVRKPQG